MKLTSLTDNMDNFQFDPKAHVYTLDGKPLSGVTTVLGVIAKPALIQWAADMACDYVRDNRGALMDVSDIVEPLETLLKEARLAHRKKKEKAGAQGTDTHALIERYVKDCIQLNNGEAFVGYKDSEPIQSFVQWSLDNKIKFIESEKRMYSREWWLAGTCDLVFEQDGKRYVGDVKTMKKLWDVTPFIQCAAYAKMYNDMQKTYAIEQALNVGIPKESAPYNHMKDNEIDGTCIINIPKETNEVETHYRYDLEGDTKAFEAALTLYRTLNP